jgi:hypothetical protein
MILLHTNYFGSLQLFLFSILLFIFSFTQNQKMESLLFLFWKRASGEFGLNLLTVTHHQNTVLPLGCSQASTMFQQKHL